MDPPEGEKVLQRKKDLDLFKAAVYRNDVAAVQHVLQNDAKDNIMHYCDTAILLACREGYDEIARILLDAGVDAWRKDWSGQSVIINACVNGHLSTVEMLLNHDEDLLEFGSGSGWTPLHFAIEYRQFDIAHFLMDRGANALAIIEDEWTTLMHACHHGADLRLVRRLLAAGVPVDACGEYQRTAMHYAANRGNIDVMQELIIEHNANIFAVDEDGKTPFDSATQFRSAAETCAFFIECYGKKLTDVHGRLAFHAILLKTAEYSFAEDAEFQPPLNPLQIRLPLGMLTLQHFRALRHSLDAESIRHRYKTRKLPIHMACQASAPVEVLSMLTETDPTTLQIADYSGALPIHSLCCSDHPTEYASVRFLVEQGGVGTLAARNRDGAMPLHVLCGSQNPSLRTVQYMLQSFPGSVAAQTTAGHYPFMIAACASSTASLSVVYELARAIPDLILPH